MKRWCRTIGAIDCAIAAWWIYLAGSGVTLALCLPLVFAMSMLAGYFLMKGLRHESRRADRNDPDPRPDHHPVLGAGVARPGGAAEGSDPRVVDEPVRGWKVAPVTRMPDGSVFFDGFGTQYGVEAVARCNKHFVTGWRSSHAEPAPYEGCECGFYAYNDRRLIGEHVQPGCGLLEVEMYGKVLRFEKGYRAEKQRVLSVTVRPECCVRITSPTGFSVHCGRRGTFQLDDGTILCGAHAMEQPRRFREFKPEPVNCETEWRWAE